MADPLRIYLVTAEPGDAVWERFGHNGLWIHDARTGEDWVWEWGIFSFSEVGFYGRLLKGTMRYSMGPRQVEDWVTAYSGSNRTVWAQELALTPDQEMALLDRVLFNYLPANREYTYNYYLDNCSTRIRDHIDAVLGGQMRASSDGVETGLTWRDHTLRLLQGMPSAYAGVQFVLGRPGDREISRWDGLFLPMQLRAQVAETTIASADGPQALVREEFVLSQGSRAAGPTQRPGFWWLGVLLVGGLLGGLALLLPGRLLGAWAIFWGLVPGILGTILALAWAFTDHTFWRWNENLLIASPLTFSWIWVGWRLLLARGLTPAALRVTQVMVGLAGVAVALKVLPGAQGNLEMLALMVPIHVGLWLAIRRLSPPAAPPPAPLPAPPAG